MNDWQHNLLPPSVQHRLREARIKRPCNDREAMIDDAIAYVVVTNQPLYQKEAISAAKDRMVRIHKQQITEGTQWR